MTSDRLSEIQRKADAVRQSKGCFVMLTIDDVDALARAAWRHHPRPGIQWRARVKAVSREVEA